MNDMRAKTVLLQKLLLNKIKARGASVTWVALRKRDAGGSHVSFRSENGFPCMQAQVAQKVLDAFCPADVMRFGITPLLTEERDIL